MLPREIFEAALHRFRTHPVQTVLTLTGLVVGTAAIIVIVALGLTGRTFVMAQIEAVVLMFWAGMELRFRRIVELKWIAIAVGILGTLFSIVLGLGAAYWLRWPAATSSARRGLPWPCRRP